jgi:hypothetical protein
LNFLKGEEIKGSEKRRSLLLAVCVGQNPNILNVAAHHKFQKIVFNNTRLVN